MCHAACKITSVGTGKEENIYDATLRLTTLPTDKTTSTGWLDYHGEQVELHRIVFVLLYAMFSIL